MTRQPITKAEKMILAAVTSLAVAAIAVTGGLYYKTETKDPTGPPWPEEIIIESKPCVAGGYQRSNEMYVMDIFIPGRGVETIEDLHQTTYDVISNTLGVCS
jgi:hypothetical protein